MVLRRSGSQSLVSLLGHWQETNARTPRWRQLADALRLLVLDGRLAIDSRLPGERELSTALGVSRTTVASALGHLRDEGFITSRQGSGSRIVLPARQQIPTRMTAGDMLDLSTAALSAGPEVHQAYSHALTLLPGHLASTGYDPQGLPALRRRLPAATPDAGCRQVLRRSWWSTAPSAAWR